MSNVWILGAGFSKSLGLPVVADLFRRRLSADLNSKLMMKISSPTADPAARMGLKRLKIRISRAEALYWGRPLARVSQEDEARDTARPWSDAEELFELVDQADADYLIAKHFVDHYGARADAAVDFRTYLACACFLPMRDHATRFHAERWRPYIRWAKQLSRETDTLVSFNYDRVVELAFNHAAADLDVVLPARRVAAASQGVRLLKLHGSIDWFASGDSVAVDGGPLARFRTGDLPVLVPPGRPKLESAEFFAENWNEATTAIENATTLVVVGYRLPESDAYARERVLAAVASNRAPRGLSVQLVLGADRANRDVERLKGMFEWALRRRPVSTPASIEVQPMFAEDFLSLFTPAALSRA